MTDKEQYQEWYQGLVDDGCFIEHTDSSLIQVNWELLSILHPAEYELLWQQQNEDIDSAINSLCDNGLLQMSFRMTDEGGMEAVYSLTDAGREYVEKMNE